MSDIMDRLRQMADLFETQQAPHNMVLHLRAAADEIARLRAGGCTRDQGTTQYCAEAAEKDAEIERLKAEVARLTKALEEIASGNYSFIVQMSFPPQDPAVNRARAALTQETQNAE